MTELKAARRCGVRCATEVRARYGVQPELVVDITEGKVPLWARGTTLNWRFDNASFERYGYSARMKRKVARLMRDAVDAWGENAPVRFRKDEQAWDFDIYMRMRRDSDDEGCVLASAFFPSSRRERVTLYPSMFDEEHGEDEQRATMIHEIGHILRISKSRSNSATAAITPMVIFPAGLVRSSFRPDLP